MKQNMLSALPPHWSCWDTRKTCSARVHGVKFGAATPPRRLLQAAFRSAGTPSSVWGWQSCAPQTHMPPTSAKCLHTGWHLHFHM